jgi:predicted nucleic acid-binding protein
LNLRTRNVLLIADSGPLIGLSNVESLSLLPRLFDRVAAPSAVIGEVVLAGQLRPGHDLLDQAPWLEQIAVSELLELAAASLGRGEVEVITLALIYLTH